VLSFDFPLPAVFVSVRAAEPVDKNKPSNKDTDQKVQTKKRI